MIEIYVENKGSHLLKEIRLAIEEIRDDIADMRPIWQEYGVFFAVNYLRRQFATEGREGKKPWAGYSREPKYRAYKKAMVGHLDVLRWQKGGPYERLFQSFTQSSSPWYQEQISKKSFFVGSKLPYADDVQNNTTGPFGEPSPARSITHLPESHLKDFGSTVASVLLSDKDL